ncbi:uncharacterized protein [Porites lutea]|uniref:uncharacterized protein isoform X2 n=1 Tax=Porites lutea TaxID=51062 RepID=UPI003CC51DC8
MHGHDDVIKLLVAEYDADINSRDHSGKKPRQVAREGLTIEAQGLLEYLRYYSDSSSESSGYGSLHSKYGSTSSSPSIMLTSQYSNSDKSSKNEASDDKSRSRSSSIGRFLLKKKQKKERAPVPNFPASHASAGFQGTMIYRRRRTEAPSLDATVLQNSFRRILGSSLESKHGRRMYNYTI